MEALRKFREMDYVSKVQEVRSTADESVQEYVALAESKSLRYEMVRHNTQVTERVLWMTINDPEQDARVRFEATGALSQRRIDARPSAVERLLKEIEAIDDPPESLAAAAAEVARLFEPIV